MADDSYSIADLAAHYDVTHRTIRYYEDQGLLSPARQGQARIYSAADRARLGWILRGKRVGFSLAEISEMLNLYHAEDGRSAQRRQTLDMCRDRLTELERQRDDLEVMTNELQAFCGLLEQIIEDPASEPQARALFRRVIGDSAIPSDSRPPSAGVGSSFV